MISNYKITAFSISIIEVLDTLIRSGKEISFNPIDTHLQELNRKYYKKFSDYFKEIPYIH